MRRFQYACIEYTDETDSQAYYVVGRRDALELCTTMTLLQTLLTKSLVESYLSSCSLTMISLTIGARIETAFM